MLLQEFFYFEKHAAPVQRTSISTIGCALLQIGEIPLEDGVGKDVIVRFITNIESNGVFYTDSNGRDFIKRVSETK